MTAMINDLSHADVVCWQFHLGGDRNFCYLLGDATSGEVAAVDPGYAPDTLYEMAGARGFTIRHILITHGHADHVGGLAELVVLTGAAVHAGAADAVVGAGEVADGQCFELGGRAVRSLATPGHSPGHMCYLWEGHLVTGDILFCGKVGGTGDYFPGSDARQEFASLHRLMQLPSETTVLPGHDYYGGQGQMPHSTIGYEKVHNPFVTAESFEAFCHLKENWAAYKKENGLR